MISKMCDLEILKVGLSVYGFWLAVIGQAVGVKVSLLNLV